MIYLDHCATTPLLPEVAEAMAACQLENPANPSSQHAAGRNARRRLEDARESIAALLGVRLQGPHPDKLVFTSGGTEANNLAMLGVADAEPAQAIVSKIEHPSVRAPAERLQRRGWKLDWLPVSPDGLACVSQLDALAGPELRLVSLMWGNNETGVLQPVEQAAAWSARRGVRMHVDAVQVAGKLPIDFSALGSASLSIAAHKFHGPAGIGALALRADVSLDGLLAGGVQEGGLRPGTQSVALAIGMQVALEAWIAQQEQRTASLVRLRDTFEAALKRSIAGLVVNGGNAPRLPHVSNLSFPGIERQALFMALDLAGVACSTGSACASGSSEPSPTLTAMNVPREVLAGSLRFSFGAASTDWERQVAVQRIIQCFNNLRPS